MNTRPAVLFVTGVLAATALVVAWIRTASRHRAEASLAAVSKMQVNVTAEIRRLEDQVAAAEHTRAGLRASFDELQSAKSKAAAAAAAPAKKVGTFNLLEAIMQDPKLQNAFFASQRAGLARTYGPLTQQLGLTPQQTGKLQDILIKRLEQKMDLQAVAEAQHLPPTSQAVATLQKQADDEVQSATTDLLGPTGAQQFQQYERTVEVRPVVQSFAGAAVLEGMPLTPQQAEQFTQALANASLVYQDGGKAYFQNVDWEVTDVRLKSILSDAQLALYRQIEPIGGGPSRFYEQLNTTLQAALKADQKNPAGPAEARPQG